MPKQSKIVILILAAGSSSRMGSPKQLLKWKNSNLLNHTICKATELNAKKIIVVLGANADMIIPEIDHKEVKTLINKDWENGLGSSISVGVNYILQSSSGIDGLLIMLADQPLIEHDHYLKLMNAFSSGNKAIITTEYNDSKQGVPALFSKIYFKDLIDLNSDFGAKQLFKKYPESLISVKNEKSRFDIDTPEQYQNLYRAYH